MLLDGLIYIKTHIDPTLTFRRCVVLIEYPLDRVGRAFAAPAR